MCFLGTNIKTVVTSALIPWTTIESELGQVALPPLQTDDVLCSLYQR